MWLDMGFFRFGIFRWLKLILKNYIFLTVINVLDAARDEEGDFKVETFKYNKSKITIIFTTFCGN